MGWRKIELTIKHSLGKICQGKQYDLNQIKTGNEKRKESNLQNKV